MRPDLPVNAQVVYEGERYVVMRQLGCEGCAFQFNKPACTNSPRCTADDINPSRIFVHLEEAVARKLLNEQ